MRAVCRSADFERGGALICLLGSCLHAAHAWAPPALSPRALRQRTLVGGDRDSQGELMKFGIAGAPTPSILTHGSCVHAHDVWSKARSRNNTIAASEGIFHVLESVPPGQHALSSALAARCQLCLVLHIGVFDRSGFTCY